MDAGRPRARAGNDSVPSRTWKRRLTPRRRDVANYSSRMVASNKSPVKWQHRRRLAQAGREDKIRRGIESERRRGRRERYGETRRGLSEERKEERRRDGEGETDSSHVRLDARRQNVNLALTHYARSGCVALGVRYQ